MAVVMGRLQREQQRVRVQRRRDLQARLAKVVVRRKRDRQIKLWSMANLTNWATFR